MAYLNPASSICLLVIVDKRTKFAYFCHWLTLTQQHQSRSCTYTKSTRSTAYQLLLCLTET